MAAPGTLGNLVAPGDDAQNRKHEDLARQVKELAPSIMESILPLIDEIAAAAAAAQAAADAAQDAADAANAAVADIAAQQAYLASLISRDASASGFNTGTLTNDSTHHLVGGQAVITDIAVPTGKVRVTASVSEISLSPAGNSVIGTICYAIDGLNTLDPDSRYARLYSSGDAIGSSVIRLGVVELPPGTYTIRAQCAYWSAGGASASINFSGIRLLAEVIGSD